MQKSVFIVDDLPAHSRMLARIASADGWNVTESDSGVALLDALAKGDEPALVIIDIHMPDLDGIELIDHLAEIRRPLRLRFITGGAAASALAAKMIASARDLSVSRSLFKPIDADSFRKTLNEDADTLMRLVA